jgi:(S)-2-hydroxyglutarate dehydrogenase
MAMSCEVVIIGGGIVGLATGLEITRRFPRTSVLVVEKEDAVARHQSGHNSGVIHSGIYYKPGSIKARTCVAGAAAMVAFCREHGIPHQICGKVIVATREDELPGLEELLERGKANGLSGLRRLNREELREIEPACRGLRALHVPPTGITDYGAVCLKYAELIRQAGGEIRTGCEVRGVIERGGELVIQTAEGDVVTRYAINCAGLHSDRVSRLSGIHPEVQIVPFRGEYYDLIPERHHLVKGLIYPVPDPRFPFLGVHFTRRIHGGVDAGPNAVLAFKREGYRKTDVSVRDVWSELTFPGLWRMVAKNWRPSLGEFYRSFSKRAFVGALQRLIPEIQESDLVTGGAGVRAQAMRRDGSLVDDFQFVCAGRILNVCNVPSPAATASLPIGQAIVQMASESLGLGC